MVANCYLNIHNWNILSFHQLRHVEIEEGGFHDTKKSIEERPYKKARDWLILGDLLAFDGVFFQVLELPSSWFIRALKFSMPFTGISGMEAPHDGHADHLSYPWA